jgi:glycerol-3-phosphate dehydrogenase (NAD(P)+)
MKDALCVAVLGAGNWGTTLAHVVARNGHRPTIWTRDPAQRDEINREHKNAQALSGVALGPSVRATCDLAEAVNEADLALMAIPSQAFRQVCQALADVIRPEHAVVHGTKGIELETYRRMSQILLEETCVRQFGVLSGPNIAPEVARGKPAGTVVATHFPRVFALASEALACAALRVFESRDICGVELCGALKNVVAIAAGMADEMGVGENAKALLVTRGMQELVKLAAAMGADPSTPVGLAGIGDLMVTCASPVSRNHRLGVALARGAPLHEATARIGMVAEGVFASRAAQALAREHEVELPLFTHIDRVLHEGMPPQQALASLLTLRTGKDVPSALRGARV